MDEQTYQQAADATFRQILDAFEDVDADEADLESTGDVLTITFASGKRCVINTQRAAKQVWLAGGQQAWHFSYDEGAKQWMDDKGRNDELLTTLKAIVRNESGVELSGLESPAAHPAS